MSVYIIAEAGMLASPDDPRLKFKSRWGKVAHSVYTQEIP